jgi:hypothetical protein
MVVALTFVEDRIEVESDAALHRQSLRTETDTYMRQFAESELRILAHRKMNIDAAWSSYSQRILSLVENSNSAFRKIHPEYEDMTLSQLVGALLSKLRKLQELNPKDEPNEDPERQKSKGKGKEKEQLKEKTLKDAKAFQSPPRPHASSVNPASGARGRGKQRLGPGDYSLINSLSGPSSQGLRNHSFSVDFSDPASVPNPLRPLAFEPFPELWIGDGSASYEAHPFGQPYRMLRPAMPGRPIYGPLNVRRGGPPGF